MRLRYAAVLTLLAGCSFNTQDFRLGDAARDVPRVDADAPPPPPPPPPPDVMDDVPPSPDADVPLPPPDAPDDVAAEAAVDAPAEAGDDVADGSPSDAEECPMGQTRCGDQCVDTSGAAEHCGRCGNRCAAANATSACAAGECVFTCSAGFADCDMMPGNGCEANLTAPSTCGSCSNRCGGSNGTPTCAGGACGLMCNLGFGNCDGNAANGCETPTTASTSHCGTCGAACSNSNGTPTCTAGACRITCNPGFGNCDGNAINGCEATTNSDAANCGGCGVRCVTSQSCVRGACTTVCPDTVCSGACVDLMTSVTHCGTCGRTCAVANGTPRCVGATCGIATCNMGFANCDSSAATGCEANTQTDPGNCGACGNRCNFPNAASSCVGGACALGTCNAGFANCDGVAANGCEANVTGDIANCGTCSSRCNVPNGTPRCLLGTCGVAACNTGFVNCDGLATNGCEVNTLIDPQNCGACGLRCTAGLGTGGNACSAGACMPTCTTGYANCDGNPRNGCEVNLTTNANCGSCNRACGFVCGAGGTCAGASQGAYSRVSSPRTFIDACAQPGRVILVPNVDDSSAPFAMPFSMRFWNTTVAAGFQIGIGSNGWVSMTSSSAGNLGAFIPDPVSPNGLIAAYMLDLLTGPMGVCVATVGAAPNRAVVIEWRDVLFYSTRATPQDFEIILNETSGAIDLLYRVVAPTPPGYLAVVGIESPAGVAGVVVCSGANQVCGVSNGAAIRFQ